MSAKKNLLAAHILNILIALVILLDVTSTYHFWVTLAGGFLNIGLAFYYFKLLEPSKKTEA